MMSKEQPKPPFEEDEAEDTENHEHRGLFVGKGFYAVLAICLVAIGGVAAATFLDTKDAGKLTGDAGGTAATRIVTAAPITTTQAAAVDAKTAAPETETTAAPAEPSEAPASALFILPLSNEVLQPFSHEPVYSKTMGDYRAHNGVDYAGNDGDAVRALADGTVAAVETSAIWGGCLTIDHGGGIISVYRGVTTTLENGATVAVGDNVGTLSGVPCESLLAPHLHLELFQAGDAVDADKLLGGQVPLEE